MNNRTEKKLKDTSGMERAIKDLLKQAWERGYKYGLQKGYESGLRDKEAGNLGDTDCMDEDAKQASIPSYQMPKDYIKNKLDYVRPQVDYPKADSHKAYWDNVGRVGMRGEEE